MESIPRKHSSGPLARKVPQDSSEVEGEGGEGSIFQVLIFMEKMHHAIWRRVLLPKTMSFANLHDVMQKLFEWRGRHPYQFQVGKTRIGVPDPEAELIEVMLAQKMKELTGIEARGYNREPEKDAEKIKLEEYLKEPGDTMMYEYDFNIGWRHVILLEELKDPEKGVTYPVCVAGERRGPQDDSGDHRDYERICQAFKAPERSEDDDILISVLQSRDPEYQDPDNWNVTIANDKLKAVSSSVS